jgi:RNA polymerase sigma factor (sigma-70 family)
MVPPCDDMSDFELIRRMADQKVDFEAARNAWGCFYVRHQASLLLVCTYDYGCVIGREGVGDLVQNAFLRAFDGATTFDHAVACEAVVQKRRVRKWLARIAENLIRDRYRGQPDVRLLDDDEDLETLGGPTDQSASQVRVPESKRLKLLKSGFALLSEVEQTVLRATMFWWQAGQEHQRMPHAAMEELSKQIGKSPANIRQIRLRSIEKLEKYVNENLCNEKAD